MTTNGITPIFVTERYDSRTSLPKNAISVVLWHGGNMNFICRERSNNKSRTEWEIDPDGRFFFGESGTISREEFLDLLKETWPEDFNAILWHPELLDCEYHGETNDEI